MRSPLNRTNLFLLPQVLRCIIAFFFFAIFMSHPFFLSYRDLKFSYDASLQQQLQELLQTLSTTEPHYIRCVKPNNLLKPAIFENDNVLQQLRCGVILILLLLVPWLVAPGYYLYIYACHYPGCHGSN